LTHFGPAPYGTSETVGTKRHNGRVEYVVFDTAVGPVGIVWGTAGVLGVQLPEGDVAATRARLLRPHSAAHEATEAAPPGVQRAVDGIVALLSGEHIDLSDIDLDMADVPSFNRDVYEIARTIAPGQTMTYGEIAAQLGEPRASREVGQALGHNPFPLIVPCHRVLAAGGKLGGFSARGGVTTKLRLLDIEGAEPNSQPALF
jgi:methylated-DNA-[protein]-cysteine S-methyltransferase